MRDPIAGCRNSVNSERSLSVAAAGGLRLSAQHSRASQLGADVLFWSRPTECVAADQFSVAQKQSSSWQFVEATDQKRYL
jgi:hypothetical protein